MLIKNPTSYISTLSIKPTKLFRFLEWGEKTHGSYLANSLFISVEEKKLMS